MKALLLLMLILTANACTHEERPSDDYVLIEFASKLEEDYDKLQAQDKDN